MEQMLLQIPKPGLFAPQKHGQPQFNPALIHLTDEKTTLVSFILESMFMAYIPLDKRQLRLFK